MIVQLFPIYRTLAEPSLGIPIQRLPAFEIQVVIIFALPAFTILEPEKCDPLIPLTGKQACERYRQVTHLQ